MANNKLQRKRKLPLSQTSVKRHSKRRMVIKLKAWMEKMRLKEIYKREFNLQVFRRMKEAGHSNKQIKHQQWLREGIA